MIDGVIAESATAAVAAAFPAHPEVGQARRYHSEDNTLVLVGVYFLRNAAQRLRSLRAYDKYPSSKFPTCLRAKRHSY